MKLTLNYHFLKACNYECKFCFATFSSQKQKFALELAMKAIDKIAQSGMVDRINFVGGEPTLNMDALIAMLYRCNELGLIASIVTNGSKLLLPYKNSGKTNLEMIAGLVSVIGLSIDSLNPEINETIGRKQKSVNLKEPVPDGAFYSRLAMAIVSNGIALKVNTVVNRFNLDDKSVRDFVNTHEVYRWKVFQVTPVPGQNDSGFPDMQITNTEYQTWLKKNHLPNVMVPEDCDAMDQSYLMLSPEGNIYSDTSNGHKYSMESLFEAGTTLKGLMAQSNFKPEKYMGRGGDTAFKPNAALAQLPGNERLQVLSLTENEL